MSQPIDPVVQRVVVTDTQQRSDEVTVIIRGQVYGGWQEVRITRGVERLPSDFALKLTDFFARADDGLLEIKPGDPCVVKIGNDPVITGYVDIVAPRFSPREHAIEVFGRGKCQDLVDCAAEWPGGQIVGSSLLEVARKLAAPYGITVDTLDDPGGAIPQFNLMNGETVFEIVERLARVRQMLAYDDVDGNLLLARVGSRQAASGLREGINVQEASAVFSMHERYSLYRCVAQPVNRLLELGDGLNLIAEVTDAGVQRRRVRVVVAETSGGGVDSLEVKRERMVWEGARRLGRSYATRVVTDSWRDKSGALYEPNTRIALDLATLKISGKVWIISEVVFMRGEQGTRCELLCMPPVAFEPQPTLNSQLPAEFNSVTPGSGAQ